MSEFLDAYAAELEIVERAPEYDTVDAKPCCKRLRSLSGASSWCYLPSRHPGDCHGISAAESPLALNDYGPKRAQTGAKK